MPTLKLTETAIKRLKAPDPSGRQVLYWDAELRGFGVLVSGKTNARSYVAQRTLPDGRTRRITVGSVAEVDLDKARSQAADLINEMRTGDPKAKRRSATAWTLRRALGEYIAAKEKQGRRPSTIRGYRDAIERHLGDWLDIPLTSISPDMVEARHGEIQGDVERRKAEAARKAGRGAAQPAHWGGRAGGATANSVLIAFRAVYNHAEARSADLPRNPTRVLRGGWHAAPRRERLVRADELPAFYKAIDGLGNDSARDFIKLLLFTGLRRGEAEMLRWDEVDFAAGLIRLPAKRLKARRKLDLPMSSFVRDLLVTRRSIGSERGGWVFPADSASGHLVEPSSAFDRIAEVSGIRVSSHDLRRTFVTVAESTDISVTALKALVNHAIGGDVTSGYVQLSTARLAEAAQRVCDRMMELCGIERPTGGNVAELRSARAD